MGYLEQVVKDLCRVPILDVGVFQAEPPVLLDIEAFVFNFPSCPSSFMGDSSDVFFLEADVGRPLEPFGFICFPVLVNGFAQLKHIQAMPSFTGVLILDLLYPSVILDGTVYPDLLSVLVLERKKRLELGVYGGQVLVL